MAKLFITPSVESIRYLRGTMVENHPIRAEAIITMCKGSMAWYPDNLGQPTIKFQVVGGKEFTWAYNTEKERDADYLRLLDIEAGPGGVPSPEGAKR